MTEYLWIPYQKGRNFFIQWSFLFILSSDKNCCCFVVPYIFVQSSTIIKNILSSQNHAHLNYSTSCYKFIYSNQICKQPHFHLVLCSFSQPHALSPSQLLEYFCEFSPVNMTISLSARCTINISIFVGLQLAKFCL